VRRPGRSEKGVAARGLARRRISNLDLLSDRIPIPQGVAERQWRSELSHHDDGPRLIVPRVVDLVVLIEEHHGEVEGKAVCDIIGVEHDAIRHVRQPVDPRQIPRGAVAGDVASL